MSVRLFLAPAAAGKTQYCVDYIRGARREEPLAPIWVIVPDAAQARAFRQRLAEAGGAFNVHVATFSTMYAEVLVLAGDALPRLDEPVLHRLLRVIIDELVASGRLTYYVPLQDKPGFFQALRGLIRELKRARVEPDALAAAVADAGPRLAELALIYGRYQQWLQQEGWADDEGRGWLAEIALGQQPDLCAGWRLLVVDGFDEFNPTQLQVLHRLGQQVQETLATLTGTASPRLAHHRFARTRDALEQTLMAAAEPLPGASVQLAAPLAHLEAALFESAAPEPPAATGALALVEAPNRAQEVRAALRWLKQRHLGDGVPLDQLAVLARDLEAYRPFLEETAAEFGLPLQLRQGTWLHQNPAVAALLDLLTVPRLNWPRRLLLEAWRSPYFDWSNQSITAADADLLQAAAQEGQVIAGLDQWQEVLHRLARASPPAGESDPAAEELDEMAVVTAPRGSQAVVLRQKLEAFVARLQPEPQATLRHYVGWLETLIGDDPALAPPQQTWRLGESLGVVNQARYGPDGRPLPTAERDVAALQRLKDVLRGLIFAESALGEGQPMLYRRFWLELRGSVEATSYRPQSAVQGALLAAPVLAARGLSFRAVALLGLCEGEFPRQPPHDPLLRPADRNMLAGQNVTLEIRDVGDEVTLFYEAITRGHEQLLVSRVRLADDGQPWEPSPYWQQLQRHSQVEPVVIRSADALSPPDAASEPEFLAALAHGLSGSVKRATATSYLNRLPNEPALWTGWQNVQAGATVLAARTADHAHGPYEGDLSHLQAQLARRYGAERPWSASRLESYAVCNYAFFASYALGFEARQRAEAGYDVRQLGSMYHAILEEVYRQTAATGATAAEVLPEIARREFDAAPATYGFRPTPLWQRQREELTQILLKTVKALDAESEGWQPVALEPPFGLQDRPPLELADDQGRRLRLRGYIDRVDMDADGRLRVIDYKSSNTPIAAQALAEGKRIQLALYALAARDVLELGEPIAGMYWHIGSARPSSLRLEKHEDGVAAALETAVEYALADAEAIRQGRFAPEPPDGGCPDWCPAADFCWRYSSQPTK
ncbi:MAG TPA: PD-(D/E)XK nuclease family protein [Anaerolineae bacterium]